MPFIYISRSLSVRLSVCLLAGGRSRRFFASASIFYYCFQWFAPLSADWDRHEQTNALMGSGGGGAWNAKSFFFYSLALAPVISLNERMALFSILYDAMRHKNKNEFRCSFLRFLPISDFDMRFGLRIVRKGQWPAPATHSHTHTMQHPRHRHQQQRTANGNKV